MDERLRLTGLVARALAVQALVAAPLGLGAMGTLLERGLPPWLAWTVALALGTLGALGLPVVLGGFSVGLSAAATGPLALAIASLPLAGVGAWHFASLAHRSLPGALGAWLVLATIFALEGAMGFALARLARQAWTRRAGS